VETTSADREEFGASIFSTPKALGLGYYRYEKATIIQENTHISNPILRYDIYHIHN
jgi:hypothetical protein